MALSSDFNPSAPTVTYQRMRQLLAEAGGGLQAGVVGATDLKVAQRGAGANMSVDVPTGAAWVAITTGTRNGLAHVYNDATANVAVTASNATNPRIDSIILRYNDTTVPTGSGSTPTLEVATGTATAGVTLDNRTGAAAVTGDFLRLADILVPAASTSVVTANIRDRRPWARGASWEVTKNANVTAPAAVTAIDSATFSKRLEVVTGRLDVSFRAPTLLGASAGFVLFRLMIDGAVAPAANGGYDFPTYAAAAQGPGVTASWRINGLAAGSHTFDVQHQSGGGTGTTQAGMTFTIDEIVRPSATNT